MALRNRTSMNALRIICACLFLSLGFAHEPVHATAPLEAYDESYRLPDGSFADICAESHGHQDDSIRPVCEICLLASSIILPPPAGGTGILVEQAYLINPLPVKSLRFGSTALARPTSRGPPRAI
ncbi:hypothetical protein LH464_06300 [Neorhizobium sp. T786]|uniref:hypothetical protein n=1 Tax=Pseudorhizobium xiangyangii TaxID=2883104 RepID=UPI001CFF5F0A|nr:hypothetical protein [Neorhizobium xiangyangii]MCB5202086.1 hypothetical protein [Neorhizobium xiangyangii]